MLRLTMQLQCATIWCHVTRHLPVTCNTRSQSCDRHVTEHKSQASSSFNCKSVSASAHLRALKPTVNGTNSLRRRWKPHKLLPSTFLSVLMMAFFSLRLGSSRTRLRSLVEQQTPAGATQKSRRLAPLEPYVPLWVHIYSRANFVLRLSKVLLATRSCSLTMAPGCCLFSCALGLEVTPFCGSGLQSCRTIHF